MVNRASGPAAWAATAFFLLLALYHLALTISTVMAFGTVNPYAEDARLLHAYLTLPFGAAGTGQARGGGMTWPQWWQARRASNRCSTIQAVQFGHWKRWPQWRHKVSGA